MNSLETKASSLASYHIVLVISSSPTDFSDLYAALKLAQGTNVSTSSDYKTIVSLDLQLYSKCIQLPANEGVTGNFVYCLGEPMGEVDILFPM